MMAIWVRLLWHNTRLTLVMPDRQSNNQHDSYPITTGRRFDRCSMTCCPGVSSSQAVDRGHHQSYWSKTKTVLPAFGWISAGSTCFCVDKLLLNVRLVAVGCSWTLLLFISSWYIERDLSKFMRFIVQVWEHTLGLASNFHSYKRESMSR